VIFAGFEASDISPMCALIDYFVDHLDLSFFTERIKSNDSIGGRPALDNRLLLKMYMYSLYCDISIRQIRKHNNLGSEFMFLAHGIHHFPDRSAFSRMLAMLDGHMDDVFEKHLAFLDDAGVDIDLSALFCDGTVFEANNSRHKIITDTNINRSNVKWQKVLDAGDSSDEQKELATHKLRQNAIREARLTELGRNSYGRSDEDCVILQDKNKSFIAGYNVQFVTENRHGLIVYAYISNKNPDSEAFLDIVDVVTDRFQPKNFVIDAGYGTPEIMERLVAKGVVPITCPRKIANAKSIINECSFELSADERTLICPTGRILFEKRRKSADAGKRFKSENCDGCEKKDKCCPKSKTKSIVINVNEFKALKIAHNVITSTEGLEIYSHRGNKCESPNGFIKYDLKGKKLTMNGLARNKTVILLYAILHNLRRMLSITAST